MNRRTFFGEASVSIAAASIFALGMALGLRRPPAPEPAGLGLPAGMEGTEDWPVKDVRYDQVHQLWVITLDRPDGSVESPMTLDQAFQKLPPGNTPWALELPGPMFPGAAWLVEPVHPRGQ